MSRIPGVGPNQVRIFGPVPFLDRQRLEFSGLIRQAESADSDEAGRLFQGEAGHLFRFHSGQCSDLKPDTPLVWSWVIELVDWDWPVVNRTMMQRPGSAACAGSRPTVQSDTHCARAG